jgi:tRNA-2-methylthio-N6-dimethylallyladenosine synthase
MNVHDSRRIEEVLEHAGWTATDEPTLASLILFNTCSVREKAEQKLRSVVGTLRPLKDTNPNLVIAIAGCVAQQEGEALLRRMSHVDIVIGPDNISELPNLIEHIQDGAPPIARTVFDNEAPKFLRASPREGIAEVTGFVTIMKGCDERCSFCIVPYTRGSERYRPADDIIGEIRGLVDGGVREITLLGQTVNSWFDPTDGTAEEGDSRFAALLTRISEEVPGLLRLRYTSPHPRHVTPALVKAHAELKVMPAHVHLPVQSGSNRVLKRMIRRYTREDYIDRARKLLSARPGMTLATDIIVGFPGETDEDFEETLSLVREVGFVAAFAFKYSPRPYTPALKLGDDVSEAVKDARLATLFALVDELQGAHLARLLGTRQEVLIEDRSRDNSGRFVGRTAQNEITHVEVAEGIDPIGALVEVTIVEAYKHSLLGRMEGAIAMPARPVKSTPARVRLPVAPSVASTAASE